MLMALATLVHDMPPVQSESDTHTLATQRKYEERHVNQPSRLQLRTPHERQVACVGRS